ncbi:hypothetical protein BJX64DRAFT_196376 [Aspergillus heterothallicus]
MGFLTDLIEGAIESKLSGNSNSQSQSVPENNYSSSSYGGGYQSGPPQPPQVPYPWVARWDDRDQRWFFLNEQTGQTSWEVPSSGGYQEGYTNGGAPQQGYYDGGRGDYPASGYGGGADLGGYYEQPVQQEKKDHTMLYAGAGVAAGVVGGALLMHEGEEIHDEFEEKKDDFEQGVENFPEDTARWTGEAVGEVEQIPDRIEDGFDAVGDDIEDAVDDVEDFPENAAGWVGGKVGEVEQFGDNMEDAYNEGVAEGRGDDW